MNLRKHATSLAIIHSADVLQPLLILPYVARVLGPYQFGRFAYAIAIGQITSTIVDYGFHWTAQRSAASLRDEPDRLASLVAAVTATKLLLCIAVTVAGTIAADRFLALDRTLFLCTMLTAAGNILFPAWLFIGLERAWQAAIAVVIARVMATLFVLAFVRSGEGTQFAVAIQASIPILSGIAALPFLALPGLRALATVTPAVIATQLRSGWRGFLYSTVERALVTLPLPLISHFSGYLATAQYSIAEKFVSASRPLFRVISETFMPRVAYAARTNPEAGLKLIRTSLWTIAIGAAISGGIFAFAPSLIILLFGTDYSGAIVIVRVLAILPLLININLCTSTLYMFNYGHERAWAYLTVAGLAGFLAVALALCAYIPNAAIAVSIALIARELIVLAVSATYFLAHGRSTSVSQRVEKALARAVADIRAIRVKASSR